MLWVDGFLGKSPSFEGIIYSSLFQQPLANIALEALDSFDSFFGYTPWLQWESSDIRPFDMCITKLHGKWLSTGNPTAFGNSSFHSRISWLDFLLRLQTLAKNFILSGPGCCVCQVVGIYGQKGPHSASILRNPKLQLTLTNSLNYSRLFPFC